MSTLQLRSDVKPIELPDWDLYFDTKRAPDLTPVRWRAFYGGRGAAKSRTIAAKLVERAVKEPERILCTREFQNSIRDSSKKVIEDRIHELGLGVLGNGFFLSTEREIRGANGSLFSFLGLHGKINTIKSLEGYTLCWIEEAATVTQASLDTLEPTIRQEGSELWVSWNPRFATDPIDKMFRGENGPPPGTVLVEVQHYDNHWFPDVLQRSMEYARDHDPDKYAHVWLGQYLQNSESKVFRNWQVSAFDTPADAVRRFGADWGFAKDPSVLVSCFIGDWVDSPNGKVAEANPKGKHLFVDYEAYGVGVEIDDTPALFAGTDTAHAVPRWPNKHGFAGVPGAHVWMITADSARPEMVSYMKRMGFKIRSAIKGPGSIEDGVNYLQNYTIVVHPRCENVIAEMTLYSYKVDKLTGDILPLLEDKSNNTIDALRYALETLRKAAVDFFHVSDGARVSNAQEPEAARVLAENIGKVEKPVLRGFGSVPATRIGFD